jgi:hypothetical protein
MLRILRNFQKVLVLHRSQDLSFEISSSSFLSESQEHFSAFLRQTSFRSGKKPHLSAFWRTSECSHCLKYLVTYPTFTCLFSVTLIKGHLVFGLLPKDTRQNRTFKNYGNIMDISIRLTGRSRKQSQILKHHHSLEMVWVFDVLCCL